MGNVTPNYNLNHFLEQSRRDKTHEVLVTPHKAQAAVWGQYDSRRDKTHGVETQNFASLQASHKAGGRHGEAYEYSDE
jgi:hypothetical protein